MVNQRDRFEIETFLNQSGQTKDIYNEQKTLLAKGGKLEISLQLIPLRM
jgi:hypothetical protein